MKELSLRQFFRASTALAAGSVIPPHSSFVAPQSSARPAIRGFKPLGKTGWKAGDISAGSGQTDPAIVNYLFECGINLIDTGAQYAGHEEILGKVLPGRRDKVFVVDKWDPPLVTSTVTSRYSLPVRAARDFC